MSENANKVLGISFYLFASSDGEVYSGGGELPRDAYVDELATEFAKCVKGLTDENPHRTIVFSLETSPPGKSSPWTY